MSGAGDPTKDPSRQATALQVVGYGKPPAEHRFQKGQSGNPNGRPRGSRNKAQKTYDPAEQPASRMILEEAYRTVTIREGDRILELPAIQAVMRAMGVSAMKGNRLAQKTLAEIVQQVEAKESADRVTAMENALEYKTEWEREIERCRAAGLPEPTPIPHPDDIIIDMRSGKVRTDGPLSKEEKKEWDWRLERRNDAQSEVSTFAARHRKARNAQHKEYWLKEWHHEQRIFDLINDSMPERYKAKLADRSYHPDASREGHALSDYLAKPKRRGKRA